MKTAVIVNPHSAAGRTARRWPAARAALETGIGPFETCLTEGPSHATELARQLLAQGFTRIIAAGGDGTVHEVVNGFLGTDGHPLNPDAVLAILPLGTGGDFRRSLGISGLDSAIDALAQGVPSAIDVGRITYRSHAGAAESRYFANLVSFGMGGEVASRSHNFLSPFGGKVAFLYATLEVFFRYRAKTVRLQLDGEGGCITGRILNVAVGNGRFHGGGMHVCPRASLADGVLDVTVIDALNMFVLAKDLPVLYSDDVYRHPKVHHFRTTRLAAESEDGASIEVDGEPLGTLPVEISVLPRRLRVITRAPV